MANQRFNIQFDFQANMGPVKSQITELQKTLSNINLPPNLAANFEGLFGKLEAEMSNFQAMTKNGFSGMADVNKAQTAFARISKLINQINAEATKVKGIDPNKLIPKEAQKRVQSLKEKLGQLQTQQAKKNNYAEEIKKQTDLIKKQEAALNGLKAKQNALTKENSVLGAAKGAEASKKKGAETASQKIVSEMKALEGTKGGKSSAEYKALGQELTRLSGVIKNCDSEMARLTTQINRNKSSITSLDGEIGNSETALTSLKTKVAELQQTQITPQGLLELRQELAKLMGINLDDIPNDLNYIQAAINGLNDGEIRQVTQQLRQMDTNLDGVESSANGARNGMQGFVQSAQGLNRATQDMEQFKNQVMYFFSMTNSVQLFKRAVKGALETVKELDKTMTEAAVVTDFSVGDMWKRLPEYSEHAQALGVSINGMYQATTLYYQQGLKTNEAMELGIETMKMAKIAGMESAQATEAMTAALRGFNMELSEASATKINDVYSQLAAITAADTEQIATAMEKTASIAANANMEFETTAALLAQIIETTQEAPETAGTAMKTIIARFSEVKSLRESGEKTGKDTEGEDIDVNKIQAALRSVGISMEGFFAGTEGLDSILIKLADKWEGLDFETQRYIATMAAGSRQQSRFIAMMSDYKRTVELVGAAQNSTGASQRQFEKTWDSMESKLQRLKNAWDEFLMGLANNTILKGAIDTLTFIIEGINKLTDALSGGNGLVKSIISLVTVVGALKLGKGLIGGLLGSGLSWAGKQMGVNGAVVKGASSEISGQNLGQSVMPDAQQQGSQAGQKWGQGFVASALGYLERTSLSMNQMAREKQINKQSRASSDSVKIAKAEEKALRAQAKAESKATKQMMRRHGGNLSKPKTEASYEDRKSGFLKEVQERNNYDAEQMKTLSKIYDDGAGAIRNADGSLQDYASTQVKVGKGMKQVATQVNAWNGTMRSQEEQQQATIDKMNQTSAAMSGIGSAALVAGMALNLLSSAFESAGLEEGAELCSKIGSALMGVGAALMMLPGLITGVASVATAAGISVQAAWWWLLIIMAVIVSIIALVYVLCSAFEAASDAAQFEKMNEQLEALSAAADEAKSKLEEMAEAKEELEELGSAFDGLVKGSREWKEALIENNQKVLDLLNTYPQLAEHVSKGLHGELTISEEGWDTMINAQQETYTHTLGAKTAMAQQVAEKDLSMQTKTTMAEKIGGGTSMKYAEFMDTGWGKTAAIGGSLLAGAGTGVAIGATVGSLAGPIGAAIGAAIGGLAGTISGIVQVATAKSPEEIEREQTGGLTYKEFDKFGALAADRGLSLSAGSSKEEFQQVYAELGYSEEDFNSVWDSMNAMGSSFDELANAAMAVREAELARVDAIAANVAQTSDIVTNSKEFGAVAEDIGGQAFENYDDIVAEKASQYIEDMDVADKNLDSGEAAEAIKKYANIQGIDEAEVRRQLENNEITKETVANVIAASETNEEMKKAMEGSVEVLEKLSQNKTAREVDQLKSLMTDRGEGLNIGAKKEIEESGESVEDYLKKQGLTEQDAQAMGYANWDEYVRAMEGNYKTGLQTFEKVTADFINMGIELNELPDALAAAAAQGLANKTSMIVANFGQQAGQEFVNTYDKIVAGLSSDQVEAFTNYMTDIDWSDTKQIEEFQQQMEKLGYSIPKDQFDNLIEQMREFGQATDDLNFEQVNTKIREIQTLVRDIQIGDQDRFFSEEEYENMVYNNDQLKEDFVQDVDGSYIYIGDDINDLVKALRENTNALLNKTIESTDAKLATGTILEERGVMGMDGISVLEHIQENAKMEGDDAEFDREDLNTDLEWFKEEMLLRGKSLNDLGIAGLTDSIVFSALTDGEIIRMANEIATIAANKGDYSNQLVQMDQEQESDRFKAEVANYTGYDPQTIISSTEGKTYMDFNPDSFMRQARDWAQTFGIDLSRYSDIYSGDVETSQGAARALLKAFESKKSMIYDFQKEDPRLSEYHFQEAGQILGVDSVWLQQQYENGEVTGLEIFEQLYNKAFTLPKGYNFEDFLYGGSFSDQPKYDINAQPAGLRQYGGGLEWRTPMEDREEKYQQSIGSGYVGLTDNEYGSSLKTDEAQIEALETLAGRYGVTGKALQDFRQAMKDGTDEEKRATTATLANTIEQKKQEKIYGKKLKILGEVNDEYATVTEGMQGYSEAINTYGEALGLDMNIEDNYAFVAENMELIQKAAQGDIDSILQLNQLLAAEHGLVITADGNFDLYNSEVDLANQKTQDFIVSQYKAGAYEVETVEVTQETKYLKPIYKNGRMVGVEEATAAVGQTIQMLRPQDAPSIERVQNYGGAPTKKKDSGGSKKEDWENPYDKHYNTLEQINEALREREKLERRYQKLLEKQGMLATNLIANSEKELAVLRQERGLQQNLIEKRKVQIKEQLSKDGLNKYASATENEFGEIEVRINWDKINAIKDEEKGSKIEEGISKIEGWRDDINGAKDALDDIEDATEEIRSRGEDEYFDLETRIKDALVQAQQDEIDKLSEINNSINDTNARLLETMQYNLEQERQMRENDKTEQELEDKQRRLEYLSQDTSGANALEIKQLEEEVAEGQQDYTDRLIDQKISELQHQNDIAAEQRQRQIDIAQSQLDHWLNTGGIWSDVYKLMDTGIGADGGIKIGSDLQKLLLSEENYNSLSTLDKVKWGKELATTAAQAVHWLKVGNSTESLIASKELKAGQSITFETSDGKTLTGKLSSNGDIVAGGKTYKDVYRNYDGNYMTDEVYQGQVQQPSKAPASISSSNDTGNGTIKVGGKINAGKAKIYDSYDDNSGEYQYFSDDPVYNVLEEKNGRIRVRHHSRQSGTTGWFKKSEVKAYKTGGLADFTGPAWLDGTKSKPELVLNAKDTQNFIQLKNILGSLMSSTSKTTENSGDSTYDIDINVERISSDYDVEQMAEKIKDLINQDARYRNNNIAGLMR